MSVDVIAPPAADQIGPVVAAPAITKADAERANWLLAHTWADNLSLEYAGVDLADCLTYNVLTVLGGVALEHLEQGVIADGQQSRA